MEWDIIRDGSTTTLKISGELDALAVPKIRGTVEKIVDEAPGRVTVDLEGLQSIDSSGTGCLLSLFKRIRAQGGKMEAIKVQGQPLQILQILRLDRVFSVKEK
jgi:anti-sigma B factor antagonist